MTCCSLQRISGTIPPKRSQFSPWNASTGSRSKLKNSQNWRLEVLWWGVRGDDLDRLTEPSRVRLHCESHHLLATLLIGGQSQDKTARNFKTELSVLDLTVHEDSPLLFTLEEGQANRIVAVSAAYQLRDFLCVPPESSTKSTRSRTSWFRSAFRRKRRKENLKQDVEGAILLDDAIDTTSGKDDDGDDIGWKAKEKREIGVAAWESEYCWWAAFERGQVPRLEGELEKSDLYSGCEDFLSAIPLQTSSSYPTQELVLKVAIAAYPRERRFTDGDFLMKKHPDNTVRNVLLRVYVLQGMDLVEQKLERSSSSAVTDSFNNLPARKVSHTSLLKTNSNIRRIGSKSCLGGLARCYVTVSLSGGEVVGGPEYSVELTSERVVFARILELVGTLPRDWRLKVSVFACGEGDDPKRACLGDTVVDIENRLYSGHRPSAGLPAIYCHSGWQRWRDVDPPSKLLEDMCEAINMSPPLKGPDSVAVGKTLVLAPPDSPTGERVEDASLRALLTWHVLAAPRGRRLLRACVETRTLSETRGRLMLWIDMFPMVAVPPPPIDISPPPVQPLLLNLNIQRLRNLQDLPSTAKLAARVWLGGCRAGAVRTKILRWHGDDDVKPKWKAELPLLYSPLQRRFLRIPRTSTNRMLRPRLYMQLLHMAASQHTECLGKLCVDLDALPDCDLFGGHEKTGRTVNGTYTLWRGNSRKGTPIGRADLTFNVSPLTESVLEMKAASLSSLESRAATHRRSSSDHMQNTRKRNFIWKSVSKKFNDKPMMCLGIIFLVFNIIIVILVLCLR